VIAAPPVDAGAVHDAVSCPVPAVSDTPVGVPGTVLGARVAVALESPVPAALIAAIRTSYAVPLVRPVMVADVAVETPSENVVHAPDGEVRYCTT
jgi:hypothetical protein